MTHPKFYFIGASFEKGTIDDSETPAISMAHMMSFYKNTLDSNDLPDGHSYGQPYQIVFQMVAKEKIIWSFGYTDIDGSDDEYGSYRCMGEEIRDYQYERLVKFVVDPLA